MKRMIKMMSRVVAVIMLTVVSVTAQTKNDERMKRDIEVAENVLQTLIKQKFPDNRIFFSMNINGNYREGYGVTFFLPSDNAMPMALTMADFGDGERVISFKGNPDWNGRIAHRGEDEDRDRDREGSGHKKEPRDGDDNIRVTTTKKVVSVQGSNVKSEKLDSLRDSYNSRVIEAAKEFISDYGDIISQLPDAERIVITNRNERPKMWMGHTPPSRTHLSIEVSRAPIVQFRQGKITRDQLISQIKVVNTKSVDEVDPDLELLSSIFNRLYRPDLSKTFFSEGNLYYERLKDFGAIFYMQVYSSNKTTDNTYDMPTVDMRDVSQTDRDKKVKELYPVFEKDLKENMLEYGRTVKSLGNDESLTFNVMLTKCKECGIPSSVEVSVKASVLKDYSAGKIDLANAVSKVNVKKVMDK